MRNISGNPLIKKENDTIFFDSVNFNDIIKQYKTPVLILLEKRIRDNIKNFNSIFSSEFSNFQCFYSFKANFLSEICKIVFSEGIGAEIVGIPELKLALKLGFPSDKIIIGGPYISKELIELSIKNQVKEMIIYDINDLEKINLIAQKHNHIQDICIRINSQKYESKLGVNLTEKKISKLRNFVTTCQNIRIKSILSHYSTQMNDIKQFKTNAKIIIHNLKLLHEKDIEAVRDYLGTHIQEITKRKSYYEETTLQDETSSNNQNISLYTFMNEIDTCIHFIRTLFRNFSVVRMENEPTYDDVIKKMLIPEAEKGTITSVEDVFRQVKLREAKGGLGIPETNLRIQVSKG